MNFIPLTTDEQWEKLLQDSETAPVIIMKHSATCGTSAYAYELIRRGFDSGTLTLPVHLLVVQKSRDLSNQIAETLNVRHQSPQILVVSKGKCSFSCSHHTIDAETVAKALRDIE